MTQEEVPPPTQPEPPQGQAPQLQADEPSASKAGRPWGETVRKVAVVALAILSYLILADAAIETIFSGAPLRWIVLGTVAAYGGASAALWRYLNWFTRAVATLGVLLAIAAGTAWLPGGLTHGIAMLGQPTSTVLAVVTGVALLMAAAILTRWNVVPLWGRTALGFIALYGLVALVSGIVNRVSYSDLFQGRSEWQRLPFWLQGAFLGALFLTGVFLVNLVYGFIQVRGRALRTWGLETAVLGLAIVIVAAGVIAPGSISGPTSPGPSPSPLPQPRPTPSPLPGSQNLLTWDHGAIARAWPVDTDPDSAASTVLLNASALLNASYERFHYDWLSKKGTNGPYTFVFELPAQATIERLGFIAGRSTDTRARVVHTAFSVQGPDEGFTDAGTFALQDTGSEQDFPLRRPRPSRWIRVTIEARPGGQTALGGVFAYGKETVRAQSAPISGTWLYDENVALGISRDTLLGPSGGLPAPVNQEQYLATYDLLQVVQHGDGISARECRPGGLGGRAWQGTRSGNAVQVMIYVWTTSGYSGGDQGSGVANEDGTLLIGHRGVWPFLAVKIDGRASCSPAVGTGSKVLVVSGAWGADIYPPYHDSAEYPGYHFVSLPAPLLDDAALNDADSVVLATFCDAGGMLADWQKSILTDFVKSGHKLIIHDSDLCTTTKYDFLPYAFTTSNPGGRAARGDRLILVESNILGSNDQRDVTHFLDLLAYIKGTQQLGDANTVTSQDPHWCGHLFGTNVLHVNGFMHMFARYGSGLIIYNGLDHDDAGNPVYNRVLQLELALPPSTLLPCTQSVAASFLVSPSQTVSFVPGKAQRIQLHLEALANQGYAGDVSLSTKAPGGLPWQLSLSTAQVTLKGDTAPVEFTIEVPPTATGDRYEVPVTGTDASGHTASAVITLIAQAPEPTGDILVRYAPEVQALNRNIEIILDASGSMKTKLEQSTRLAVAKKVLGDLVKGLPPDVNVALRVFGHRKAGRASCTDTELLVPLGSVTPQMVIAKVDAINALGDTPLVANLLLAAQDMAGAKAGTVVAVTDGEETCGGNVDTVASQLRATGVQLVVNIVGFTLADPRVIATWTRVAQGTGGAFFKAENSGQLSAALQAATHLEYAAYDAQGKLAGKEAVGQPLHLPPGMYTIVVRASRPVNVAGVKVASNETATYMVQRTGADWSVTAEGKR